MVNSFSLVFIIILSVLLFGSIETWAFALVGAITILFFNLWLYRNSHSLHMPKDLWQRIMSISIMGFLSFCLFQVIPIPVILIKALSPSTYTILKDMSSGSFQSISLYRHETINGIIKLIVYLMIFMMTASLTKDMKSTRRIIVTLVLFGFVLSFFAIIQKSTWNGKIYWFRELTEGGSPFGPFVNRNHFAGFMGMIIPLGLSLALESRKMAKSLLFAFLSLIMVVGLFYSLSRGGIVSFLLSIGVFSILIIATNIRRISISYLFVILPALLLYLFYLGISPVIGRFASDGLSSDERLLVWSGTFKAFKDFIWFGTGLGTFRHVFPVYSPQGLNKTYHYAHNDYLQLLLETGIIGMLFVAVLFISIVMAIFKYRHKKELSFIMSGLIASMFYMLIHSIFDFNLHMPSNAIMFSMVLGLIVSYARGDLPPNIGPDVKLESGLNTGGQHGQEKLHTRADYKASS